MKQSGGPVFLLLHTHVHPDLFAGRSTSFIGVFSCDAKASNSLKSHALLEGFKDCQEGFSIQRIELDSLLADPVEIWE